MDPPTPSSLPLPQSGTSTRRLSAAGLASALKDRALIEPRPPLTRTSFSERPSIFDPDYQLPAAPPAATSTPQHRKRRMSSDADPMDGKRQKNKSDNATLLGEIRDLIRGSEERTIERLDKKIDALSENLSKRLDSTERDVKRLGRGVKEVRSDMLALSDRISKDKQDLPEVVERVVAEKLAAVPGPSVSPAAGANADKKIEAYLAARNSLRVWPVLDLSDDVVRAFLTSKLKIPASRAEELVFKSKRIGGSRAGDPPHQALITFDTSRQRDEVKAAARNLTDREVGVQMEPPDHLRSHYQAFQSLAYQLKTKHPLLKRNVKFSDADCSLEMDFNIGDGRWRTIGIKDTREALKRAKASNSRSTRRELAGLLGTTRHSGISDSSSCDEDTMVEVSDSDDNQYKDAQSYPPGTLSLFTANARSLIPKLESLFDCMTERNADFGVITETWINEGRQLSDLTDELRHAYSLGIISRSRASNAHNGRAYGGVALIYRLARASFRRHDMPNPDDYEVLASVGNVSNIKPKIFCLSCYAPPNISSLRARGFVTYISDLVAEAKRTMGAPGRILGEYYNAKVVFNFIIQ